MYGEEKSAKYIRYQSTSSHPSKGENRSQSCKCKQAFTHFQIFSIDEMKMKNPINAVPSPKINTHSNTTTMQTPMESHLPNGYKETTVQVETQNELTGENEEKLLNNLVKFVKDKLNTSTLSLAELKKLLLLHPTGKYERGTLLYCEFLCDFRLLIDVNE